MHVPERILLYSVALVLGAVLLLDQPAPTRRAATAEAPAPRGDQKIVTDAAALPGTIPDRSPPRETSRASDGVLSGRSFVVVDDRGQPRIELLVSPDGRPRIGLKDGEGRTTVVLEGAVGGGGRISVSNAAGTARLSSAAGDLAVELLGKEGAQARMTVRSAGGTEITTRSGPHGCEAVLRTGKDGSAEVAVGGDADQPVATLAAAADGHLALSMLGAGGRAGPVMQLFDDGLAQIALDGPGSKSGPSLIRFPNGMAVMAVRLPDGNPGASMVASPDGTSVVAAIAKGGQQQAELRAPAGGKPTIAVVELDLKPEQPEAPQPRRRPTLPPNAVLRAP